MVTPVNEYQRGVRFTKDKRVFYDGKLAGSIAVDRELSGAVVWKYRPSSEREVPSGSRLHLEVARVRYRDVREFLTNEQDW